MSSLFVVLFLAVVFIMTWPILIAFDFIGSRRGWYDGPMKVDRFSQFILDVIVYINLQRIKKHD